MDFPVQLEQLKTELDGEAICGAPMTLQSYGTRLD